MSHMRFSIVVPTYNRVSTLRPCLRSLLAQDYPNYEIIVVDDGSTDSTPATLAQEFPPEFRRLRYLRQKNAGPAVARNRGIQAATGEIVAFTDDDCLAPPDWLTQLASGYTRHSEVVGVGGGLSAPPEILATNPYAQYERYIARVIYQVGEIESLGGFECPAGGTANMSYRKSSLEAVHGFDQAFPVAAGEDADLKMRICQQGHRLLYVPVQVVHLQDYTWERFKQQCYVRGVGRNYFEQRHGAGAPSRFKIGLRVFRRLLAFPSDLWRMPDKKLAFIKLTEGLITCLGQWNGK